MKTSRVCSVAVLLLGACMLQAAEMDTSGTMWWPYLEWSIDDVEYSGNPFDVVAKVTFEHEGSDARHVTEMFYDGGSTWKFRFTGTRVGTWTFTTRADGSGGTDDNAALHGHSGTVEVASNEGAEGFLRNMGNKFAVQYGDNGGLKGYVFNVFMGKKARRFTENANTTTDVDAVCDETKEAGSEIVFIYMVHNWFKFGTMAYDEHDSENPDPKTFQWLEEIIARARTKGCRVMLWAWGDEARKATTIGVGGINGEPDRRLQRYIAARLGPVPGWTMGYGFDLHEFIEKEQLRSWAEYLHAHMGWQHLLSARATDLQAPCNMNGYAIADQEHGDFYGPAYPDMSEVIDHLDADTDNPHLYEERHTWQRWGLDETRTRRLIWRTVMANGMGGWYGYFDSTPLYPESVLEAFRTHYAFWHTGDRFQLDFERANDLTNGYCLKNADNSTYIVYREGESSIDIDLSGASGALDAVAVNCNAAYAEQDVGPLSPGNHTIELGESSDWVVAIGDFSVSEPVGSHRTMRTTGHGPQHISLLRTGSHIVVKSPGAGPGTIRVSSSRGQVVYSGTVADAATVTIPWSGRPRGLYVVEVSSEGRRWVSKLVRRR